MKTRNLLAPSPLIEEGEDEGEKLDSNPVLLLDI